MNARIGQVVVLNYCLMVPGEHHTPLNVTGRLWDIIIGAQIVDEKVGSRSIHNQSPSKGKLVAALVGNHGVIRHCALGMSARVFNWLTNVRSVNSGQVTVMSSSIGTVL